MMIFNAERFPTADEAIRSFPRRVTWRNLAKVLRNAGFHDVIDFHDGGNRITANLFATNDPPWNVTMERSVTFRLTLTRVSRRAVLSTMYYVMPDGKRMDDTVFDSPRDAIIACLEAKKHVLEKQAYKARGKGRVVTMNDDDDDDQT